jgi:two-component system, NtrC family, response regulator HydG
VHISPKLADSVTLVTVHARSIAHSVRTLTCAAPLALAPPSRAVLTPLPWDALLRPRLDLRVPSLSLLQLSASFGSIWPDIAKDCELPVREVTEFADLGQQPGTIAILAAGGEEDRVEALLRASPITGVEIAVVGAIASHRLAVTLMLAGAGQYFALPEEAELLRSWVRERAERQRAQASAAAFADAERRKYNFEGILGTSASLREALDRAARIIPHGGVTVLITGETGTGKELLARAIHYNGPRRDAPFVDINCAAIPEHLLESELFGHEKGAFTDATSTKPGLFELANTGTLFLDEIGHLAPSLQGKLLRALEERQVRRVGGSRLIPVDVRVVAATHVDLAAAARQLTFREDLYYRLNVVPLELPPLRERRSDIPMLVAHFIGKFAREYGMPPPALSPAAEQMLNLHSWRGNIRELRNVLERAVLLCREARITPEDLAIRPEPAAPRREGELPFPTSLAALTHAAVEEMLRLCRGNKSEAARQLGISRPRLMRLLEGESSAQLVDT